MRPYDDRLNWGGVRDGDAAGQAAQRPGLGEVGLNVGQVVADGDSVGMLRP